MKGTDDDVPPPLVPVAAVVAPAMAWATPPTLACDDAALALYSCRKAPAAARWGLDSGRRCPQPGGPSHASPTRGAHLGLRWLIRWWRLEALPASWRDDTDNASHHTQLKVVASGNGHALAGILPYTRVRYACHASATALSEVRGDRSNDGKLKAFAAYVQTPAQATRGMLLP